MFYTWDWLYCLNRTGNGAVPGAAVAVTPVADEGVQEKLNQIIPFCIAYGQYFWKEKSSYFLVIVLKIVHWPGITLTAADDEYRQDKTRKIVIEPSTKLK
ncbi:hypothetical protein AV530_016032 [Patagioenas fasciata monilis]|uniref:Uncharacterized protein n=1 Tax=Patagioenas fasciata monilis TaxID=372326 RepID=A0A1V4KJS7_PATFA|nr:hypothetical protein AV530_016032 [Patagioenas fasciata monilis]